MYRSTNLLQSSGLPLFPKMATPTQRGRQPRWRLLALLIASLAVLPPTPLGDRYVVGDNKHWAPNVNYTLWANQYHFYIGDWIVFRYAKGMYDLMEVNATAYEDCNAANPIFEYSKGDRYAFELKEARRYYFICSRGYCYQGMKVSLLVQPRQPPPAPAPKPSSASACSCGWLWAVAAAVALPFSFVRSDFSSVMLRLG